MKLGARKNPPGVEAKKGPQQQLASWTNGPTETGSNQSQRRTNQEGKNLNDSLGLHNHNVRCRRVGIKPLKLVREGRNERTRRCQIDQMKLRDQAGSKGQAGLQFGWAEHNKSRPVRPAQRCPVDVSNREIMDPGNLPRFQKDPQSGSRFSNWAYGGNAGTRWTSKYVSWVEPSLYC